MTSKSTPYPTRSMPFHFTAILTICGLMGLFAINHPTFAQANTSEPTESESLLSDLLPDEWYAVVTVESLVIRHGRSPAYSEIARLEQGDLVRVRDVNEWGWATIAVPDGTLGCIAASNVVESEEGLTVATVNKVKVLYNTDEDPSQCWRGQLVEPETPLEIVERIETTKGLYYHVIMPEVIDAYTPSQFLRQATEEEIKTWIEEQNPVEEPVEPETVENPPVIDEPEETIEQEIIPPVGDETPPTEMDQPEDETTPDLPVEDDVEIEETPVPTVPDETEPEIETVEHAPDINLDVPPEYKDAIQHYKGEKDVISEAQPEEVEPEPAGPELPEWDTLETLYTQLKKTPILEAEIEPLLAGYTVLADDPSTNSIIRELAEARIKLLNMRLRSQENHRKLEVLKQAAEQRITLDETFVLTGADGQPLYDAVGRVASSTVYDGQRLPLMYRLIEHQSGRTILYFAPTDQKSDRLEVTIDTTVGLVGTVARDPSGTIRIMHVEYISQLTTPLPELDKMYP